MGIDSDVSSGEVPPASHPSSKRACPGQATDAADNDWHPAADGLDAESEWQARLREESGAELRGCDEEDWDRYGSVADTSFHISSLSIHPMFPQSLQLNTAVSLTVCFEPC